MPQPVFTDDQFIIPAAGLNPQEQDPILNGIYAPKNKTSFLTAMLRALKASEMTLFRMGRGSLPHRVMDAVAQELEFLDFSVFAVAKRAVRESAYRSFYDPVLFPKRFGASYAHGTVEIEFSTPVQVGFVVKRGVLFSTRDGRTSRVLADTPILVGDTVVSAPVVSEIPGISGNVAAGEIIRSLNLETPEYHTVLNRSPIGGGREVEGDAEIYERFRRFILSRATGNRLAVLSAAYNATYGLGTERVISAALIFPWRIPTLNTQMSYGYVVIDSGGGLTSPEMVAAAQLGVDTVVSMAQDVKVIAVSLYLVEPQLKVTITREANTTVVLAALQSAWDTFGNKLPIENGEGGGRLDLFDLSATLDKAHPSVVSVLVQNYQSDIHAPIGARISPGTITATFIKGDEFI